MRGRHCGGRQYGSAGRLVAGCARPGRSGAACPRRRNRPAAGGAGRRLAPASGHGPTRHEPLPSIHRGPCSLHRGSGRGTGWSRRQPVRHPRSRPGHLRAAQAGDRLRPAGVRNRPASSSGLEAAAPDRARLRHPRVAAAGGGRLRGRLVLVGAAGDRRKFARAAGTPFISFFSPLEMLALAREAGFRKAQHVSAAGLTQRYFAGRTDGLRPSSSEELLVATT